MKFLICLIFLSMNVFAQDELFQEVKGNLGVNVATKKNIEFTLKWKEKDGKAEGSYSDNYYTDAAIVKGISGELGRIFVVTFPKEIKGVRTISFLGSDVTNQGGTKFLPLSIVLRDDNGKPVSTKSIQAAFTGVRETKLAQRQEDDKCQDGFGALAGYCGLYLGMLSEESDTKGRCNLLTFNNTRLVLDENAEIGLTLGESSAVVTPPIHRIGRAFTDTETTRVDLLSRQCRALPGTTFLGDDCKRLHLTGLFSARNGIKHFAGDYTILNEKTNESCRYNLSMDQTL